MASDTIVGALEWRLDSEPVQLFLAAIREETFSAESPNGFGSGFGNDFPGRASSAERGSVQAPQRGRLRHRLRCKVNPRSCLKLPHGAHAAQ